MADILIRGMEMPQDCGTCFVGNRTICKNRCPIGLLPEKHGRLIDADVLISVINILEDKGGGSPVWEQMRNIVRDMVTIVPAEGGTDNG